MPASDSGPKRGHLRLVRDDGRQRPYADDFVVRAANKAMDALDRIRRDGPEIVRRAKRNEAADGYPPSSGLDDSGSHAGGHGDPVVSLAARRVDDERLHPYEDNGAGRCTHCLFAEDGDDVEHGEPRSRLDPVAKAAALILEALPIVNDLLAQADVALARAKVTPDELEERRRKKAELEEEGLPGCVNCARFDIYVPADRAGRCWACYQYRIRHDGEDAPERIVMAREHRRGHELEREVDLHRPASSTDWTDGQHYSIGPAA